MYQGCGATGTAIKKGPATVTDASQNDRPMENDQQGTSMQTNVPPKPFALSAHAYFRVFTQMLRWFAGHRGRGHFE